MTQRLVPAVLIALLAMFHAQMWFGRGSLPNVSALEQELSHKKILNAKARLANEQLASEIEDLRSGLGMVEEKARMELGMVRPDEIFVQVTRMPALNNRTANRP